MIAQASFGRWDAIPVPASLMVLIVLVVIGGLVWALWRER